MTFILSSVITFKITQMVCVCESVSPITPVVEDAVVGSDELQLYLVTRCELNEFRYYKQFCYLFA